MKNILYILLSISILYTSCDEYDSDITLAPGESKLVLNAFISPEDTLVRVRLSQTVPTIGASIDPMIYNAIVTITDGVQTDTMNFDFNESAYTSTIQILPSTTYTIKANTNDGRWAEASCTTLSDVPLDFTYSLDSTIADGKVTYSVTLNWKDSTALSKTYYRTDAELMYIVIDTVNQSFNVVQEQLLPNQYETVAGAGYNQPMSVVYKSNAEMRNVMKFMELHLLMVDETYYNFDLTKKNSTSGFPNFEYSKLYSNVKNGLGIVASYHNHVIKPINIE